MTWTVTTTSWPMPAEPRTVFAALTDAEQLRAWFAEHAEVEPRIGGAYRFWGKHTPGTPAAAPATQRLTEFAPHDRLAYAWTMLGVASRVRLSVAAADGNGTKVTAEHEFDRALDMPRAREYVDDFWRLSFGNLSVHLGGGSGFLRPDFSDPSPEIRLSILIAAPPAAVFRALIDPALVNQWVGSTTARVEPRVGGVYAFGWQYEIDGRQVAGGPTKILELEPDRRLVVDWPDWRGDASVTGQTIAFTLAPEGTGTRVELVHAGFSRAADVSDYPFGWGHFAGELRKVAEAWARGESAT